MMKLIRLAVLMLVTILAIWAVATSAASAAKYLFRPQDAGKTFLGLGLPYVIRFGANIIRCEHDTFAGTIANVHLFGPFDIHFFECESTKNNETFCKIGSPGLPTGQILTTTLHALLGQVLPSGLGGVLILPTEGTRIVKLEKNSCTAETTMNGNVAGLLVESQLGHEVLDLLAVFIPKEVSKIDTLNGEVKPRLELFGVEAALETVFHLKFHEDVEIELT